MPNYILLREHDLCKMKNVSFDKKKGLNFTPTKQFDGAVAVEEMILYDPDLISAVITKKVMKKYEKLLRQLETLFDADDDSGTALEEALNLMEKFRQEISTKYLKFLKEKELEMMGRRLSYLQRSAKMHLLGIGQLQNIDMESNKRSR